MQYLKWNTSIGIMALLVYLSLVKSENWLHLNCHDYFLYKVSKVRAWMPELQCQISIYTYYSIILQLIIVYPHNPWHLHSFSVTIPWQDDESEQDAREKSSGESKTGYNNVVRQRLFKQLLWPLVPGPGPRVWRTGAASRVESGAGPLATSHINYI